MDRQATQQLLTWKDSARRKPLLLRGARQVGKSWLIDNALSGEFSHYTKVDLERRSDLHPIFDGDLSPTRILALLELEFGPIPTEDSLLFFDEIQACPRAITALRYFYEELPGLHVVAAGSLLEFSFSELSFPVGRLQSLHLKPLSFVEFLWATDQQTMAQWLNSPVALHPPEVQRRILAELKQYAVVGGMPEAVLTFAETGRYSEAFAVQNEILETYQSDFHKYSPRVDTDCLQSVFLQIAESVGEQVMYTKLNRSFSSVTNKKAYGALNRAGLCTRIPATSATMLPLGMEVSGRRFKSSFLDVGLWHRLCKFPITSAVFSGDLLDQFRGKMAEQLVAQELACHHPEIFYWRRAEKNSNAEVDFLVAIEEQLVPIEVKSGPAGRLRSLHMFLQRSPDSAWGVVLYDGCYRALPEQRLLFLPLYCAGMMQDGTVNLFG